MISIVAIDTRAAARRIGVAAAMLAIAATIGLAGQTALAADPSTPAAVAAADCCPPVAAAAAPVGLIARVVGFFDNYGNYMPRIHCLRRADGTPDWPWIATLLALNAGVMIGYAKIFRFWRRSYLAEAPRDRNAKLMDLAHIFLWCAVCGYGLSIVMFWWPAYRLNAIVLAVLNFFTWKFAGNLSGLRVSLSAFRLQRELEESFANRAAELERLVVERTAELEHARAAAIAADQAKGTFLANMSHEIRTPMTAILGFTQILAERDLDDGPRKRYTQIVRENSQHLLNVINDVLDMARIEAGQVTIARVPCDLPALLREVQSLYSAQAGERSLTLSLDVAPAGVPARVLTDPTRLRQVLFNLVGNALKFTERGGVTIVARPDDAGRTAIEVVDTGIGMTAEQSARLFERFQQADPTTTRRFGGSGLGLVISRHLVTLLGGEIRVRSVPGEGSRFTVAIPFERVADENVAPASKVAIAKPPARFADVEPRDQPLAGLNVLVADDAEDNRGLVRYLLETAGARVELAHDGREAVDAVVNAPPGRFAAVLMDMHMPLLDGYGATAQLRDHGATLPIIAVTASSMAGDRERCLAAGCDAYATKPVDGDELIALIRRLTRGVPLLAGVSGSESNDVEAEHDRLP